MLFDDWYIEDARGVRRRPFDAFQTAPWRTHDDPVLESDLAAMRRDLNTRRPWRWGIMFLVVGAVIVLAGAYAWRTLNGIAAGFVPWLDLLKALFFVVSACTFVWLFLRSVPRFSESDFIRLHLMQQRCPSCGYKLAACDPEQACVTCPECSGVWYAIHGQPVAPEDVPD